MYYFLKKCGFERRLNISRFIHLHNRFSCHSLPFSLSLYADPLSEEQRKNMSTRPRLNQRRQKDREVGPMFPETRTLLEEFFRPCNEDLAKLLNDDRFLWKH